MAMHKVGNSLFRAAGSIASDVWQRYVLPLYLAQYLANDQLRHNAHRSPLKIRSKIASRRLWMSSSSAQLQNVVTLICDVRLCFVIKVPGSTHQCMAIKRLMRWQVCGSLSIFVVEPMTHIAKLDDWTLTTHIHEMMRVDHLLPSRGLWRRRPHNACSGCEDLFDAAIKCATSLHLQPQIKWYSAQIQIY